VDRSGPLVAALTLALVYVVGPWLDTRGEAAGVWTRRRWISLAAGVSVAYPFVRRPPPGVGRLLVRAREARALDLVRTREEALAWLARHPRRCRSGGSDRRSGG
jgi:hypothetical protein